MKLRFEAMRKDPRIQPLISLKWKIPFPKREDPVETELIEKIERSGK